MVLESSIKLFQYYRHLGESAMIQLTDEELFGKVEDSSNTIPVIVKHLSGNMLSRWTNFLTADGEKSWRNREDEFTASLNSRAELLSTWNLGWAKLLEALSGLEENQLTTEEVYIRNQGHFIVEAIQRQLAHYAYHVGQIVFIAKSIKKEDWKSLSIPKGASEKYNSEKFDLKKEHKHFTSEFLKEK